MRSLTEKEKVAAENAFEFTVDGFNLSMGLEHTKNFRELLQQASGELSKSAAIYGKNSEHRNWFREANLMLAALYTSTTHEFSDDVEKIGEVYNQAVSIDEEDNEDLDTILKTLADNGYSGRVVSRGEIEKFMRSSRYGKGQTND